MAQIGARRAAHIRESITSFFEQAKTLDDVFLNKFLDFAGISLTTFYRVYSRGDWWGMRDAWLRSALIRIMDRLQARCDDPRDFTITLVLREIPTARSTFRRLVGDEFRRRKAAIPVKEKPEAVVARLERLNFLKQLKDRAGTPPADGDVRVYPGGWVDLNADLWDLRFAGGQVIERGRLRPDLSGVAWEMLRGEIAAGRLALTTVCTHHREFLDAGGLLGSEVPDVRAARLEAVQRAWVGYDGSIQKRAYIRRGLLNLFIALINEREPGVDVRELALITGWLRSMVSTPAPPPGETFFSERELDGLIAACLRDIKAAIDFTDINPGWAGRKLKPNLQDHAVPVLRWGVALMLLVSAFTGLRRRSLAGVRISDLLEIRSGLFAIAWQHTKTSREKLCVLPAPIAHQLQLYARRTAAVRSRLGADLLFLVADKQGYWRVIYPEAVNEYFRGFVGRHGLRRDGAPLPISNTILRRTYTTRELYEGRSLASLQSQLGHASFKTTKVYEKFDRYEHPAEVRDSLDRYGRKALALWRAPLVLEDLDPEERTEIFDAAGERDQEVGVCRHERCVKAERGGAPPCSLCEHLITGREFLSGWEAERARRERELRRLEGAGDAGHILAQRTSQYKQFAARLAFVKGLGD